MSHRRRMAAGDEIVDVTLSELFKSSAQKLMQGNASGKIFGKKGKRDQAAYRAVTAVVRSQLCGPQVHVAHHTPEPGRKTEACPDRASEDSAAVALKTLSPSAFPSSPVFYVSAFLVRTEVSKQRGCRGPVSQAAPRPAGLPLLTCPGRHAGPTGLGQRPS